ncbi:MAG: lysophospholipid acyltransferase family protein [Qingshengfaniella sp.]
MNRRTWHSPDPPPEIRPPGWTGILRAALRGGPLILIMAVCLALMGLLRLIERPLCGLRRPLTPGLTLFVCRAAFVLTGVSLRVRGQPMVEAGIVVANHSTWFDIFALNARQRVYFVAKQEVAGWAGIGLLAKVTGTLFISRDRGQTLRQKAAFEARLGAGQRLLFFPEGTSSDGQRVLRFNPTLFAAAMAEGGLSVQPVTVIYTAPEGQDPRFYAWWGTAELAPHLLHILAAPRQGQVEVIYHPPRPIADFADRKALAVWAEETVRAPFLARGIGGD